MVESNLIIVLDKENFLEFLYLVESLLFIKWEIYKNYVWNFVESLYNVKISLLIEIFVI